MATMSDPVIPTPGAKNVGDLKTRPRHAFRRRCRNDSTADPRSVVGPFFATLTVVRR